MYFEDETISALQWVREDLPGLWSAFALRHQGIGIGSDVDPIDRSKHDAIRRTTLENLPLVHIGRVFVATKREVQRLVEIAETRHVSHYSRDENRELWSLRKLADVLGRFSTCMDSDERGSVLSLALRLTKLRLFRDHPSFQETVYYLVQRIVPYLTIEQINHWVADLLIDFPMYGRDEDGDDRWPLITDFINLQKVTTLVRPESVSFDAGVKTLIACVSEGRERERTVAALRLIFLEKYGLLSAREIELFSAALWRNTDSSGLPKIDDSYVSKFVHLDLPMISSEPVVKGLSLWIMSNEVGDRFRPSMSSSKEGRHGLPSADPDHYLDSINGIARRIVGEEDSFKALFHGSIRKHILQSILSWWNREHELFRQRDMAQGAFDIDPFDRVDLALKVILRCVLDKSSDGAEMYDELQAFLHDICDLRVALPYTYPIYAFLDQDSASDYWGQLLVCLWHSDQQVSTRALSACLEWQRAAERLGLPRMPQDVAVGIVSPLARLDGEFSYHAYAVVAGLLTEGKFSTDSPVRKRLRDAVESAATRLAYGRGRRAAMRRVGLDLEMHAHFRRRLASVIYTMYENDLPVGCAAARWFENAKQDRFVDVRFAATNGRWT